MRTFVAVADAGSISRAASTLFVTQPAVTRRLQRFEHACGSTLLDRRQRPFALTPSGQAIVERCRELLVAMKELRGAVAAPGTPVGELAVGVAHALNESALVRPVEAVQAAHPGVALRFETGWSREILDRVRTRRLDAGVVFLPEGDGLPPGVVGEPLARESLVVIAARGRRRVALPGAAWVLSPEGCAARANLLRTLRRLGHPHTIAVETYTYDLQLALVARRRGLGLVPARLLAESPWRPHLRVVSTPGLAFPLIVWGIRGRFPGALEPVAEALEREVRRQLTAPARSGSGRRARRPRV